MKILFACHRLPYPPIRGGKIRPFNIIRHLTHSGHSVTVASLARSDAEAAAGEGLNEFCDRLLVGRVSEGGAVAKMILRLPTRVPSSMGYFYSRPLYRDVQKELRTGHYDLVFVHCSSAAQYLVGAKDVIKILDFGDLDSQKWIDYANYKPQPLALGYRFEGWKLWREEIRLARRFDLCTCTTPAELETLEEYDAARQTGWFPNGVDKNFFAPLDGAYDADQICFIGRMDYFPNQQGVLFLCNHVLPLVQAQRPATRLTIVGAEPAQEIRALAKRPGIRVTGTVDDVRDFVRASALSVAPLTIVRGTQNKILESMAMGVPVVASEKAAKGVDAIAGKHLLTACSAEEYAQHILGILENPDRRRQFAAAGRTRAMTHHSWETSMRSLDKLLERACRVESSGEGRQIGVSDAPDAVGTGE